MNRSDPLNQGSTASISQEGNGISTWCMTGMQIQLELVELFSRRQWHTRKHRVKGLKHGTSKVHRRRESPMSFRLTPRPTLMYYLIWLYLVYVSTIRKMAVNLDDRPKKDKTRRYVGAGTTEQNVNSAPQITSSPLLSNLQG